jgi:hypothetical protein
MATPTLAEMSGHSCASAKDGDPRPVFLLGIMHRSGTNFLAQLLEQHPRIGRGPVPEDFLVAKMSVLELYLHRVIGEWNPRWSVDDRAEDLRKALGAGISAFAILQAARDDTYALARTPSVGGLSFVRRFLPDAHLIILVRDGRAVVESGRRSFGWNFDDAARRWDSSARMIRSFISEDTNPARTIVVRYEDLVSRTDEEVGRVLGFLDLNPAELSDAALANTPVIGSSDLKSAGDDAVHWEPAHIEDFRPLERFAAWTKSEHVRFDWLAGEMLEAFGYTANRMDHGKSGAAWQNFKSFLAACRPTVLRRSVRRLVRGAPPG